MIVRLISLLAIAMLGLAASACSSSSEQQGPKAPAMGLHEAALKGDTAMIQQHIDFGSDLNAKDEYGSTPLIVATTFGQDAAALALINAGADTAIANQDGSTPLHTAAFFCRTDVLRALLDKGADRQARNNMGATAYDSAAAPYEMVKPIYEMLEKQLGPLGLQLDHARIESTRPQIAAMLKE
ncbi:MAG: uncharacterized protein PWP23_2649 [Candidatus Sumerlaeota bacterium]|nr:uncharacterized protein [Candidatus Sumerlaeota bacterium]